jgi:hypothetical protein
MTEAEAYAALEKVGKWRAVLTGRILGTRLMTDPAAQGFRDLFEKLILLRVEVSALGTLLVAKELVTAEELVAMIGAEALHLDALMEAAFPGITTTAEGTHYSPRAAETMKGWPP